MRDRTLARRQYAAARLESLGRRIMRTEITRNVDGIKHYRQEDHFLMQHIRRVGLKVLAEAKAMRAGNHGPHRAKAKSHPPASISP